MTFGRFELLFYTLGLAVILAGVAVSFAVGLRLWHLRKNRHWQRLEEQWSDLLYGVLAGDIDPAVLYQRVADEDRLRFVNLLARYARRVSGKERRVLRELAAPYLPFLAQRVHSAKPQRRAWALQTLGRLGASQYAHLYVAALDDADAEVAMVAASALARPEFLEHAPLVYRHLNRFGHWSLRALARLAAGFGPQAAPALRTVFMDEHERGWVRAVAAAALFLLRDYASADAAAQVLATERDRDLVIAAAQILSEYGERRHLPTLRSLINDRDFVIRMQVIEAIGRVGEQRDLRLVQAAMADRNPWVALRAGRALAGAKAIGLLEESAQGSGGDAVIAREALALLPR